MKRKTCYFPLTPPIHIGSPPRQLIVTDGESTFCCYQHASDHSQQRKTVPPTRPDTYLILIWDKPIVSAYPAEPHCTKRCFKRSAINKYDIWNQSQNKIPLSPADVKPPRTFQWQPSAEIAFSLLLPPCTVAHWCLCILIRQPVVCFLLLLPRLKTLVKEQIKF